MSPKPSPRTHIGRWIIEQGPLLVLSLGVVIASVLFFIPGPISIPAAKTLVITFSVIASFFIGLAIIFRNGVFSFPKDEVVYAFLAAIIAFTVSALFSGAPSLHFWGAQLGGVFSTITIILLIGVFFLSNHVIKTYQRAQSVLIVFLTGIVLLFLYHLVRFFAGAEFLTLGVFSSSFGSPAGSWFDLGILFTLGIFLIALVLEFRVFQLLPRILLGILAILLIVALLIMNIKAVWIVSGFVSLVLILSIASFAFWSSGDRTFSRDRRLPLVMIILFIVSVGAMFLGPRMNAVGQNVGAVVQYDPIRPTLRSTIKSAWFSIKQNPLVGVGIGNFNFAFINANTFTPEQQQIIDRINGGYGWIPTLMTTTGILGIVAILGIIGAFFSRFLRMARIGFQKQENRFFVFEFFALGLVVVAFSVLSVPSLSTLALGALFLGGWYGLVRVYDPSKQFVFPFLRDPKISLVGLVFLLGLAIVLVGWGMVSVQMFWSERLTIQGIRYANNGDTASAERMLNRAIALWKSDLSLGTGLSYLEQEIIKLGRGASQGTSNIEERFLVLSSQAKNVANKMVLYNEKDYRLWSRAGNFLIFLGGIGVQDAFQEARQIYIRVVELNPNDARLKMVLDELNKTSR